jgi:hypothetical protein
MLTAVAEIIAAIVFVVQAVPIGTNLGLVRVLWGMVNGSFLESRGAIHRGLLASNFGTDETRRSWAALRYGCWQINEVIATWQLSVASRNQWRARRYGGDRVKSVDITGFWRPRLAGQVSKPYHAHLLRKPCPLSSSGS